jgi:hypothetical protein
MEPVLIIVPGVLGGVAIALALSAWRRRINARRTKQIPASEALPPDAINMSSIRVAGIGGLGLVAMAVAVAWKIPRIGLTMELGLLLGALMAVALIAVRHRFGVMPSSGRHGGANTVLAIDDRAPTEEAGADGERRTSASSVPLLAPSSCHRATGWPKPSTYPSRSRTANSSI